MWTLRPPRNTAGQLESPIAIPGQPAGLSPTRLYDELTDIRSHLSDTRDVLSNQTWQVPVRAADATVRTHTAATEATIGTITLPLGTLNVLGKVLSLRGWGHLTTDAGAPGNLTIRYKAGGTTLGTTGAIALTLGLTNVNWRFNADARIATLGAPGTIETLGEFVYTSGAGATLRMPIVNTAPVSLTTTGSHAVVLTAEFSTALNSITSRVFALTTGGAT